MSARDWPPEGVCAETGLKWGARPQRLKQCVADRSVARIDAAVVSPQRRTASALSAVLAMVLHGCGGVSC